MCKLSLNVWPAIVSAHRSQNAPATLLEATAVLQRSSNAPATLQQRSCNAPATLLEATAVMERR